MTQSYQEVSKIIVENLVGLKRLGVNNLNKIKTKECSGDYQDYFFYRKSKHPEKYERLMFDTNGPEPYCGDLGEIIISFIICGFLDFEKNIRLEPINKYLNDKQRQ